MATYDYDYGQQQPSYEYGGYGAAAPAAHHDVHLEVSHSAGDGRPPPPPSRPPPPERPYMTSLHGRHGAKKKARRSTLASTVSSHASSNGRKSSVTSEYDDDEGESKTTLFLARLVVSIFAVGLLWLTSLSTVVQIVNLDAVIDVPEPKEVFNTGIEMYNVTIRLRNEYIECIADAVSECNQSLYVKMENEGARVAAASKVNVEAVNVALEVQSSCSSSRAYALAAVTAWQERQGLNSTNHYTDACTAEERSSLAEITGDLTAQKSATYSLINGYTGHSNSTVESLLDRIEARASYDGDYLYNKTLQKLIQRDLDLQARNSGAILPRNSDGAILTARPRPAGDQRQPLGADRRALRGAERHRDARVCDDQQERVRVPGRLAPRPARRRQLGHAGQVRAGAAEVRRRHRGGEGAGGGDGRGDGRDEGGYGDGGAGAARRRPRAQRPDDAAAARRAGAVLRFR